MVRLCMNCVCVCAGAVPQGLCNALQQAPQAVRRSVNQHTTYVTPTPHPPTDIRTAVCLIRPPTKLAKPSPHICMCVCVCGYSQQSGRRRRRRRCRRAAAATCSCASARCVRIDLSDAVSVFVISPTHGLWPYVCVRVRLCAAPPAPDAAAPAANPPAAAGAWARGGSAALG